MFEFHFQKPLNKNFNKKISCYLYDGWNLTVYTEDKLNNLYPYKEYPGYIRMFYTKNGFIPETIEWLECDSNHRSMGPAHIDVDYIANDSKKIGKNFYIFYGRCELHLTPFFYEKKVIASKYINGKFIFAKEIKTLKDWFNFEHQQDIITKCTF